MGSEAVGNDLLLKLLSATELRSRIISSNLANQSTPGYLRRVVRFEDLLREVLDTARTPEDALDSLHAVAPEVSLDEDSPARPDGNNVSLEVEMNALRENRLLYETYAAMLQGRFQLLEAVIRENG